MKTKGQSPKVAKLERLAYVSTFGGVPERLNGPACKAVQGATNTLAGSNPALSARLTSPTRSANCGQGLSLGLAPKAGLLRSTVIVRPFPKKRKVLNDVPQLPKRMQAPRARP